MGDKMPIKTIPTNEAELNVLKGFFHAICDLQPQDSSISKSKLVKDVQRKLKAALRNSEEKCSCAKHRYGPCETCQASSGEIVSLRNFFRVIKNAKKHNLTGIEIQEFIENNKRSIDSAYHRL
jgi:hypothetical protein